MKSKLFHIAHKIKGQFETFAEALTHAWKVIKLNLALLAKETVCFSFKKVDGSIREAVGTLKNVPAPKGVERKANYSVLNYFDLQQQDFRCCRVENIIFLNDWNL